MVVELQRSLALVATVNATPSFDTTLTVVLFKEILMKKLAWLLGAVALVGLSACDDDENNCGNVNCDESAPLCVLGAYTSTGADMCLTANKDNEGIIKLCGSADATAKDTMWYDGKGCVTKTTGYCNSDSDCEKEQTCNTQNHVCEDGGPKGAKLVRIDDLSETSTDKTKEDPGADIDAIVLTKKDGTNAYATSVLGYLRGDGVASQKGEKSMAIDPTAALNEPDSFLNYPNHKGECYLYKKDTKQGEAMRPFVSLGGKGGYLIVEMGDVIEAGDTLNVLELGGCTLMNRADGKTGTKGQPEGVEVRISITNNSNLADWKVIGDSEQAAKDKNYEGILSIKISDVMLQGLK